jgi:hypothetical protein
MNFIEATEAKLKEIDDRFQRLEALQHNLPPLVPVQQPEPKAVVDTKEKWAQDVFEYLGRNRTLISAEKLRERYQALTAK